MVKDSCIDYMHVVCLGCMNRLLSYWVKNIRDFKENCDKYIDKIVKCWPEEFQRKIRHLKQLSHFKATEFRIWVLYIGPAIMRFFLSEHQFKHFLLLHHGLRLLFLAPQNESFLVESQKCINEFLTKFPDIYPGLALTYIIHAIEHLPEDCRLNNGTPDSFSAFPYENYLRRVKRNFHGGNRHLEQVSQKPLHVLYIYLL